MSCFSWHSLSLCLSLSFSLHSFPSLPPSLFLSSLPTLPPSFFLSHGIIINNGLFDSQYVLLWIICYTTMFHILFLLDSSKEFSGLHEEVEDLRSCPKAWSQKVVDPGFDLRSTQSSNTRTFSGVTSFLPPACDGLQRAGRGRRIKTNRDISRNSQIQVKDDVFQFGCVVC